MAEHAIIFTFNDTLAVWSASHEESLFATSAVAWTECDVEPEEMVHSAKSWIGRLWNESAFAREFDDIGLLPEDALSVKQEDTSEIGEDARKWLKNYACQIWFRALKDHGVDDMGLAVQLADTFRAESEKSFAIFHDAADTLEALSKKYRLCLAARGLNTAQREKIERAALNQYFETIIVSGELGCGKPRTALFEAALNRLAVLAGDTILVGSNIEWDIVPAKELEIKTIWCNIMGEPSNGGIIPDSTVFTLSETPRAVEGLLNIRNTGL